MAATRSATPLWPLQLSHLVMPGSCKHVRLMWRWRELKHRVVLLLTFFRLLCSLPAGTCQISVASSILSWPGGSGTSPPRHKHPQMSLLKWISQLQHAHGGGG